MARTSPGQDGQMTDPHSLIERLQRWLKEYDDGRYYGGPTIPPTPLAVHEIRRIFEALSTPTEQQAGWRNDALEEAARVADRYQQKYRLIENDLIGTGDDRAEALYDLASLAANIGNAIRALKSEDSQPLTPSVEMVEADREK